MKRGKGRYAHLISVKVTLPECFRPRRYTYHALHLDMSMRPKKNMGEGFLGRVKESTGKALDPQGIRAKYEMTVTTRKILDVEFGEEFSAGTESSES